MDFYDDNPLKVNYYINTITKLRRKERKLRKVHAAKKKAEEESWWGYNIGETDDNDNDIDDDIDNDENDNDNENENENDQQLGIQIDDFEPNLNMKHHDYTLDDHQYFMNSLTDVTNTITLTMDDF